MLKDLDDTLVELLKQKYLTPENKTDQIDIVFNRPDKIWEGGVTKLTINLFLYDIRENLQLRTNERYITRNGTSGQEIYAATRMDFTYLISVWSKASSTVEIEEEHEILGKVLTTLLSYPVLPPEVLKGEIAQQSQPPRAWIAQPEDTPKTWEFWGSNEWRLKAGISYRVTLHIQPKPIDVDLVTTTEIQLKLQQPTNS